MTDGPTAGSREREIGASYAAASRRWPLALFMTIKRAVNETFNRFTRQLHLYGGLFLCPFLLIFAVSTIRLNHGWQRPPDETTTTVALPIPADLLADVTNRQVTDDMTFGERAAAGQPLLDHIVTTLDLQGEIAGAGVVRNGRTALNVARPGLVKQIEVDVRTQEATITELRQGLFGTMRYLHLNPGPHRQPQWMGTTTWGWVADATVYITLLLTLSGIYLWVLVREERKAGIVVLGAGAVSFVAVLSVLLIG